jgi:hypothetical protein
MLPGVTDTVFSLLYFGRFHESQMAMRSTKRRRQWRSGFTSGQAQGPAVEPAMVRAGVGPW